MESHYPSLKQTICRVKIRNTSSFRVPEPVVPPVSSTLELTGGNGFVFCSFSIFAINNNAFYQMTFFHSILFLLTQERMCFFYRLS